MKKKLLLENVHIEGIRFYDAYRRTGGYRSVEKALKEMTPESVVEEVKKSGLRGRGGGISYWSEMEFYRQTRRRSPPFGMQCR